MISGAIPSPSGPEAAKLRRRARVLITRFHLPDDGLVAIGSHHQSHVGIWRVAQRLGGAAAHHSEDLSRYHADSRSIDVPAEAAPKRVRPKTPQLRESLQSLIRYYSENAARMRYDEYLRLGYGIGSGAVESAHKQVVHARFRQAGMRWSEAGARRLLALRLLLVER